MNVDEFRAIYHDRLGLWQGLELLNGQPWTQMGWRVDCAFDSETRVILAFSHMDSGAEEHRAFVSFLRTALETVMNGPKAKT